MTHQSPNGRPPERRPRHAPGSRLRVGFRRPTRATIRLVAAAGSILAGLCLVVGAVALVAEMTELPSATHLTATAHQRQTGTYGAAHPARTGPAAPRGTRAHGRALRPAAPATHVIAGFAGHGTRRTREFTIGGAGTVQLEWSVDCGVWHRAGGIVVQAATGGAPGSIPADQAGQRGHGGTAAPAGAGVHYLTINPGCAWKMRVLTKG